MFELTNFRGGCLVTIVVAYYLNYTPVPYFWVGKVSLHIIGLVGGRFACTWGGRHIVNIILLGW